MSKAIGHLLLVSIFALAAVACRPVVTIPSPMPLPSATTLPAHTPMSVPSSTSTPVAATSMQEVTDLLSEAAVHEAEQDLQAAQASAFQALALYLSLQETQAMSEERIAHELFSLADEAGVNMWLRGAVDFLKIEETPPTYLVKLGFYHPIGLFWGQGTPLRHLAVTEWPRSGQDMDEAITEARLSGDGLGVIFAHMTATTLTPDFILLRREGDGWRRVWPSDPEPWRDLWITLDGDVSFPAGDLSLLRTEGSSRAVSLEEDPFLECQPCLNRHFDALWERRGDQYLPRVTLPLGAPYHDRLWEITQPSPYASLFEFLRRLRSTDEQGALELVAEPAVVDKAMVLHLNEPAVPYLAFTADQLGEQEGTILFSTEDVTPEFIATLMQPNGGKHWLLTDIAER